MNISCALPEHAAALAELDQAQPFSAHWNVPDWQREFTQAACQVYVAQEAGHIVGFVALRGAAGQYELLNLAVHAPHTRRGIGFQLVTYALAQLAASGAQEVTLEVDTQNTAAIKLYEKLGFAKRGVRPHFYANGADAWIMGKEL